MFYDFAITVPANTALTAPVSEVLKLTKGTIHKIEVQFPIGTLGLMHCRILHHEHQAWPTNPDGSFASDGYVIPIDEDYDLEPEPYELKVVAWNLDDTYQHVLTVRVGILRSRSMTVLNTLASNLDKLLRLLGMGG